MIVCIIITSEFTSQMTSGTAGVKVNISIF